MVVCQKTKRTFTKWMDSNPYMRFVLRLISVLPMLGPQVGTGISARKIWLVVPKMNTVVCIKDIIASRPAPLSLEQFKEKVALHSNSIKKYIREATQNTDKMNPVPIRQVLASQKPNKLSYHLCEKSQHFI